MHNETAIAEPVSNTEAIYRIINTLGDGQTQRELTDQLEQCLVVLRGAIPCDEKICEKADSDSLVALGARYISRRYTDNDRLADAVDEICRIIGA